VDPSKCTPQQASAQGQPVCGWTIEIPCFDDAGTYADGGDLCSLCAQFEDAGVTNCGSYPTNNGSGLMVNCNACCIGGRAPRGFVSVLSGAPGSIAARLAEMAQLEAASVFAFRALHDDLRRLGAPRGLLAAVRKAEKDEVRHARVVGRAARRFGAHVPRVSVAPASPRSIEQLAIENAEEGCVRETVGAAIAAVQAEHATDAGVRHMMKDIAAEELAHAALAWRISRWVEARLDAPAAARVREARRAALVSLMAEAAGDQTGSEVIGLPDASRMIALLQGLSAPLETGDLVARAA
jgi:hypothetical protein